MISRDNSNALKEIRSQLMKYKTSQPTTSDSWKLYLATDSFDFTYEQIGLIYKCAVEFHYDTTNPCVVQCYMLCDDFRYSGQLWEAPGNDNRHRFYTNLDEVRGSEDTTTFTFIAISTQPGYLTHTITTRPY